MLIVQSFPRSSVLHIPTKAPRRIQRRRLRDWGVIQWSGSKLVAMVECKESHSTGPAWSYCRYTRTHAACIQTIFLKHQRYIRFGRYLEHPKGLFIGVGYQTVLSNDTIDYQTVLSTIKRYYQTVLSTDSRVRHNPENTKKKKKTTRQSIRTVLRFDTSKLWFSVCRVHIMPPFLSYATTVRQYN